MNNENLIRTLVIIVAVVFILPFLLMMVAWPMMGMWGGGHMWDWNGTGVGWIMFLLWLFPLALLLAVGYLVYRGITHTATRTSDAAVEELRLAYARGDLSEEEFEKRREKLTREQ